MNIRNGVWVVLSVVCVVHGAYAGDTIEYPAGYRSWAHVKTLSLHDGHPLAEPFKGIHHVYANPAATEGVQSGRFADGSILVFDLLAQHDVDHASVEGERLLLAVMVKNSAVYAETGGWGFEAWQGDSRTRRLVQDGGQSCFACHASQTGTDFVYSRWRD